MPDTEKELRLADALRRIEGKLEEIEHLITGNGTPEKGLIVRIDRLEQQAGRMNRAAAWLIGVFGAVAVTISLALLKVAATHL